jgi:hypothetical protein
MYKKILIQDLIQNIIRIINLLKNSIQIKHLFLYIKKYYISHIYIILA